jgi:RNA polymerase sigma factor (sigma-70 family)
VSALPTPVHREPATFAELHSEHDAELRRFTLGMLRDPHDAADATQETWMRAFVALRDPSLHILSVRGWLFAVARNVCLDRLRDGKRCAPAEISERQLGAGPAPGEVLELRGRAREALTDLAALSERQRAAVVLRELAGLDGEDLARALHTDSRRASGLLSDARRSLAELRAGRGLSCEATRHELETARVRTRAVRAHLADCRECEGYARRRVASRLHVHGLALFVLALPARLRALWSGGAGTLRPLGAVAAVSIAAAVPAGHELHHSARAPVPHVRHAPRAAAAVVVLPATAPARHARAHPASRAPKPPVRHAAPRSRPLPAAGRRVTAPAAAATATATATAPRPVVAAADAVTAPVAAVTQRVTTVVGAAVPAAAPILEVADRVLAPVGTKRPLL